MEVLRCFLLGVMLTAGTSLAVDVNWLTRIVKAIRNEYKIDGQFCLAANIPLEADSNALKELLTDNNYENKVKEVIGEKNSEEAEVYESDNMVVARPSDPEHAESRVLSKLQRLTRNSARSFLLIYSYLSPCSKCTDWKNKYNILKKINEHIDYWEDGAFVFTKVYDKPPVGPTVSSNDLTASLKKLGESMGGLKYVFRCDGPNNPELECYSCSERNRISDFCINNNLPRPSSGRERSQSESSISRGGGSRRSSSESRDSSTSRGGGSRRSSSESRDSSMRTDGGSRRSSSESRDSSTSRGGGSRRSSSESRASSISRGGGSSRKRNIYRSQSESSISSSESRRKAGKNQGGGRSGRKMGRYRSESSSSSRSG